MSSLINRIQRVIPQCVKHALRPHYRLIYPNKVSLLFQPTSRCNYNCSYCLVRCMQDKRGKSAEHRPSEWIKAFEKFGRTSIILAGGEPTLYEGILELVDGLTDSHDIITFVTNGSAPLSVYSKLTENLSIQVSYHRECISEEAFLEKLNGLIGLRRFRIGVNLVASKENLSMVAEIEQKMLPLGVCFEVLPMFGQALDFHYTDAEKRIIAKYPSSSRAFKLYDECHRASACSAGRNHILVTSDGSAYRCQGWWNYARNPAMVDGKHPAMGNVFDPEFSLNKIDLPCDIPCRCDCDRPMVIRRVKK